MANQVQVVFHKEVVDNLRDRRSVLSALITPLVMPVFLVALIMVAGKSVLVDPVARSLNVPIQGMQYAPGLVEYLRQQGAEVEAAPTGADALVQQGELDLVLVIPADYASGFSRGQPVSVQIIQDTSRQPARAVRDAG